MSACPVTVHGLLHIADGIEAAGPVWATWAFVMERYCGYIKRSAVRSRKHPLASIDNRILEVAQLEIAKMKYGLTTKLSLRPKRGHTSKEKFPECKPHLPRRHSIRVLMHMFKILDTHCCVRNGYSSSIPVLSDSSLISSSRDAARTLLIKRSLLLQPENMFRAS